MPGRCPRVLTVAGSDPGGGAGLQLDLKVFTALGADGAAVPAVWTVQGPAGLARAEPVDAGLLREALAAVFADGPPAAVKTGALGSAPQVEAVAEVLAARPELPVVCDPVLGASRTAPGGPRLLDEDGVVTLRRRLLPRATVLTPNLPEARVLAGAPDDAGPEALIGRLLEAGARAVFLKGGHFPEEGEEVVDLLATPEGVLRLAGPRLPGASGVHGTGCALAAALAVLLARGLPLAAAAAEARRRLQDWLGAAAGGRLLPRP